LVSNPQCREPLQTKWCYDPSDGELSKESSSNKLKDTTELSPLNTCHFLPTLDSLSAQKGLNTAPETQSAEYSDDNTSEEVSSFINFSAIDRKDDFCFGVNYKQSNDLMRKSSALTLLPPFPNYEDSGKLWDNQSKKLCKISRYKLY
jgi:hypothetical protein